MTLSCAALTVLSRQCRVAQASQAIEGQILRVAPTVVCPIVMERVPTVRRVGQLSVECESEWGRRGRGSDAVRVVTRHDPSPRVSDRPAPETCFSSSLSGSGIRIAFCGFGFCALRSVGRSAAHVT